MLTIADVKAYLNISNDYTIDDALLTLILQACEDKVRAYTGVDPYKLDENGNPKRDLMLVILMLCSSAYNNRDSESEVKFTMTNFCKTILDMHCQNLVG
ncbi:head-tail connector protein [Zhenhengia yiwuensis]|uniref:Phage gp6-like head-tail connector protein n=1 Tax=Zhenhengia yiwuensis TaxID=2763666 RepID=A0A926IF01_9FIRM|nr:head-tail connector protein [Zhenhengia yiwuensis]MBC8580479.1 phage gp6-like head-tail connector protein [Zhenhengia yiwuensis]